MVPHIILRSINTVFQRVFHGNPQVPPLFLRDVLQVRPSWHCGLLLSVFWNLSVALQGLRWTILRTEAVCTARREVMSKVERAKAPPPSAVFLRGMCIWLGQDESITAPGPARTCQRASAKCYYSVSPRDNEAESWLPGTKRSKRSKGRSTNKNGDCPAHQGFRQSPFL